MVIVLLGVLLMMMAGAVAGGWTMDRMGRKTGLLIGGLGLGLFIILLGLIPIDFARVIAVSWVFSLGSLTPGLLSTFQRFFRPNDAVPVWDGQHH